MVKKEMKSLGIPGEVRKSIQSHRSKAATSDMDEWYDHADNSDADREALEAWEAQLFEFSRQDSTAPLSAEFRGGSPERLLVSSRGQAHCAQ